MARPREFDYETVLDKAMRLFWRQGYQGTSIDDLERETGLTKGSLYKAFDSKRDLFVKSLERYMVDESYKAVLLRMADRPMTETYARMMDLLIASAAGSERPCGCLATNVIAELLPVDEDLAATVSAGLAGMQQALTQRLRRAQEKGEFKPATDIDSLAALLMVTLQGMVVLSTSTKDITAMRRTRAFIIHTLEQS